MRGRQTAGSWRYPIRGADPRPVVKDFWGPVGDGSNHGVAADPALDLSGLARRAQAGDDGARDALLRDLYTIVRKHVVFTVGGAVAEDAVQEAMIAIHRGLPSFRGDANPRTWAITIALRTARRMRRREQRQPT